MPERASVNDELGAVAQGPEDADQDHAERANRAIGEAAQREHGATNLGVPGHVGRRLLGIDGEDGAHSDQHRGRHDD